MTKISFIEGAILPIDKPLNWTSFDVVKKIRYEIINHFNIKKIKVGHAGTLDPLATGLIILCTGKKTKTINELIIDSKYYEGEIRLGATTPSFDLETVIDQNYLILNVGRPDYNLTVGQIARKIAKVFKSKVLKFKKEGKKICGYAASAKSTTALNYCGIGHNYIDFIADSTKEKTGKFTPGTHIPVVSIDYFRKNYPDIAILCSWNHKKEIMEKEKEFKRRGGKWISHVK